MDFQHLRERKLSYFEHLQQAFAISWKFFLGSVAMIIHGLYPDVFTEFGTDTAEEVLEIVRE